MSENKQSEEVWWLEHCKKYHRPGDDYWRQFRSIGQAACGADTEFKTAESIAIERGLTRCQRRECFGKEQS